MLKQTIICIVISSTFSTVVCCFLSKNAELPDSVMNSQSKHSKQSDISVDSATRRISFRAIDVKLRDIVSRVELLEDSMPTRALPTPEGSTKEKDSINDSPVDAVMDAETIADEFVAKTQKMKNDFDEILHADSYDSSWGPNILSKMDSILSNHLSQSDVDYDIDCKSSICKLEMKTEETNGSQPFVEIISSILLEAQDSIDGSWQTKEYADNGTMISQIYFFKKGLMETLEVP